MLVNFFCNSNLYCFLREDILSLYVAQILFRFFLSCIGMEEGVPGGVTELSSKQRHQMKHRELFLSRQVETMPATHIRGKCCVTLLNETESLTSYLNKEDSFFYCLVFDPAQRTLLADKGKRAFFFYVQYIRYKLKLTKLYLLRCR